MYLHLVNLIQRKLKIDAHYLMNGGFWALSGHVMTILSVLVTSYIFANYLDPVTYGNYKYLLTAGIIVSAFSLTGLSTAVTQAVAKKVANYFSHAEKESFKYGLIVSAISIIGATYYAINENWQLAIGLLITALLQPLMNTSALVFSQFIGNQEFKDLTKAHTIRIVITTLSTALAIFLSGNIYVLLLAFLLSNILANFIVKKIYYPPTKELATPESVEQTAKITNYAKHISVQNILSTFTSQIDKILIFQNLGAVELAIYAFAIAIPDQYKGFTKTIEMMVLPRFSKNSEQSVKSRMLQKSVIYFVCLLIISLAYILLAPFIFKLLYPNYADSVMLSQIYSIGIIFGIGGLPISAMQAKMAKKRLHVFNIVTSVFQIAALLILLPIYGLLGAIVSKVLYRAFVTVSAYVLYFHKVK